MAALTDVEITEANFPGWAARVDGAPTELLTVDGMFRGVWVPAGEHRVELRFEPTGFVIGRWVSLLALVVLVGIWAWPVPPLNIRSGTLPQVVL